VKNKPLPVPKLVDLSNLPDRKQEEIYRDLVKNTATIMDGVAAAGYALVVWHMDGTVSTAHWAARGPVGRSMIPSLAHDALLIRVATLVTEECLEDDDRIPKR
jgi:hypothetical protein